MMEALLSSEEASCRSRLRNVLQAWLGWKIPLFRDIQGVLDDSQLRAAASMLGVTGNVVFFRKGDSRVEDALWDLAYASEDLREAQKNFPKLDRNCNKWLAQARLLMETECGSSSLDEQKRCYFAKWGVPTALFCLVETTESLCRSWLKLDKDGFTKAILVFLVTLSRVKRYPHVTTLHLGLVQKCTAQYDQILGGNENGKYTNAFWRIVPNIIVGKRRKEEDKGKNDLNEDLEDKEMQRDDIVLMSHIGEDGSNNVFSAVVSASNSGHHISVMEPFQCLLAEASAEVRNLLRRKEQEQHQQEQPASLPPPSPKRSSALVRCCGEATVPSLLIIVLVAAVLGCLVGLFLSWIVVLSTKITLHVGECMIEFRYGDFGKVFMYSAASPCTELKVIK